MPAPPVVDTDCLCQMHQAHMSRLNTIPILRNANVLSDNVLILIPGTKRGIQVAGELLLLGYPRAFELVEDRQILGMNKAVLLLGSTDLYIRYGATLDDQWEVRFYPLPPT